MNKIIISIDPGINGAIAIIENNEVIIPYVYSTPVKKIQKNGKSKNDYNIELMANIVEKYVNTYKNNDIIVVQEFTHAMPNQGTVSMYSFGRGAGIWEGIVGAYHLEHIFVSPMIWKTEYKDKLIVRLEKPDILKLKTLEINKLSASDLKKHKEAKIKHKKDLEQAKKLAKDNARELAGTLYPNLKEEFILKKDDGKAEALLIAEYFRRQINARK